MRGCYSKLIAGVGSWVKDDDKNRKKGIDNIKY